MSIFGFVFYLGILFEQFKLKDIHLYINTTARFSLLQKRFIQQSPRESGAKAY